MTTEFKTTDRKVMHNTVVPDWSRHIIQPLTVYCRRRVTTDAQLDILHQDGFDIIRVASAGIITVKDRALIKEAIEVITISLFN